jgi:hypothetical protein
MVAAQLVEIPKIPYFHSYTPEPLSEDVLAEADRLTTITLSNLPHLLPPMQTIIHLLHQLGISYAKPLLGGKIDSRIIQPLYEVEYALLTLLSAQKATSGYPEIDVLLAEAYQLYFWTGPRMLPPQTRLCDLLVSRLMKALLPLVLERVPEDAEDQPGTAQGHTSMHIGAYTSRALHYPEKTNNAIIWALALGVIVSAALNRPEHLWLKAHFWMLFEAMGLNRNEEEYLKVLGMFPTTDGFLWTNLRSLYGQFRGTIEVGVVGHA